MVVRARIRRCYGGFLALYTTVLVIGAAAVADLVLYCEIIELNHYVITFYITCMAGLGLFDQKSAIAVTMPIVTAFKFCIGHRNNGPLNR
jgi:hypothetical protein